MFQDAGVEVVEVDEEEEVEEADVVEEAAEVAVVAETSPHDQHRTEKINSTLFRPLYLFILTDLFSLHKTHM